MLKDAGTLRLTTPEVASDDARQDFPGFALAIIVEQPSDVERLAALAGERWRSDCETGKKAVLRRFFRFLHCSGRHTMEDLRPEKEELRITSNSGQYP